MPRVVKRRPQRVPQYIRLGTGPALASDNTHYHHQFYKYINIPFDPNLPPGTYQIEQTIADGVTFKATVKKLA